MWRCQKPSVLPLVVHNIPAVSLEMRVRKSQLGSDFFLLTTSIKILMNSWKAIGHYNPILSILSQYVEQDKKAMKQQSNQLNWEFLVVLKKQITTNPLNAENRYQQISTYTNKIFSHCVQGYANTDVKEGQCNGGTNER